MATKQKRFDFNNVSTEGFQTIAPRDLPVNYVKPEIQYIRSTKNKCWLRKTWLENGSFELLKTTIPATMTDKQVRSNLSILHPNGAPRGGRITVIPPYMFAQRFNRSAS